MALTPPGVVFESRTITQISGAFTIPAYQRGYRWTEVEVNQLLFDVSGFDGPAYYLQPIVVRRSEDDRFEVVDGQQRLTTLFLLLQHIARRFLPAADAVPYTLSYETRPGSAEFLRDPALTEAGRNIDFFHMARAEQAIRKWFENRPNPLLSAIDVYQRLGERVKVIWYEIPPEEDALELFRRLNMGRIPLTSAELVKAAVLTGLRGMDETTASSPAGGRAAVAARQWDAIEVDLRDPARWAFVSGGRPTQAAHLELLLDAMAVMDSAVTDDADPVTARFTTFERLRHRIAATPDGFWDEVLDLHSRVVDWFEDRDFYHQIGFLTTTGTSLAELVASMAGRPRSEVRRLVEAMIRQRIGVTTDGLADLKYGGRGTSVERVLLLFNIETVRRAADETARYPFAAHARTAWSVEHIDAQNAEGLVRQEQWRQWLLEHAEEVARRRDELGHAAAARLVGDIGVALDSAELRRREFEQLEDRVVELLGATDVHTLENLALLSQSANSALSNALFGVKRHRLLTLEREGAFIPPATRNVFLKAYSSDARPHLWGPNDRQEYLATIRTTLRPYLAEEAS